MMQPDHDLPYDLEGEILSHLPIQILARFRCVCKRWNTLFKERRFFNSDLGLARPQFILLAESKICSVDVNLDGPSIEVHNLPSDIPGYKLYMPMHVEYCDGLFLYATCYGIGICNPWLRQIRWFKSSYEGYDFSGMGYDNSRQDKHYKILGSYCTNTTMKASVTELGSDAWKSYEFAFHSWNLSMSPYSVSLNGNLYWVAYNHESRDYFIQSFDFSTVSFKPYCILPTKNGHRQCDGRSLAVFREDRFSFLEQEIYNTRNIEIWVTKETIKNGDGEAVEWVNLMSVLVPEWSSLSVNYYPPSYFVDEGNTSIIFVKFYYRNGNVRVAGAAHGDSTETRGLMVPDDDYIEAVQGTYTESHITSMAFRLHKGNRSLRFGFFEGMSFVLGGGRGSKIIGFYGRSSDLYLTAFGVHFSPLP
ncbi:F-box domain [Arabidopsis suecica]|uniref:F-box domain n=1 Tax=Arabidopsis suecica TaxID=45249 RepID=A0A8T2FLD6_ARASU|nr:F-box domain [Arabidopsis suecica]